ncbi:hypothetical protein OC834_000235 [Tilletia horrida]|nr:hypothetical protein OC834_000235 [Tilletia horrida]
MPLAFGLSARRARSSVQNRHDMAAKAKAKAKSKAKAKAKGKSKAQDKSKDRRAVEMFSDDSDSGEFSGSSDDSASSRSGRSIRQRYGAAQDTDSSEGLVGDEEVIEMLRAERRAAKAASRPSRHQSGHGRHRHSSVAFSESEGEASDANLHPELRRKRPASPGPSSIPMTHNYKKSRPAETTPAGRTSKTSSLSRVAVTPTSTTSMSFTPYAVPSATRTIPASGSAPRTVWSLCDQLFEVARVRDRVRAGADDRPADPWLEEMFEHVFTLLGSAMASAGAMHSEILFLLHGLNANVLLPPPLGLDGPHAPVPSRRIVFAETVFEFNRLTGRSVSAEVLWTEPEARSAWAKELGVQALKHSTSLPFAFIVRDEDGNSVSDERLATIRSLIREAVADLEALPDKRQPNSSGQLPTRCRSYFQTFHRHALLQAVRTIESNAPEMALCKNHYKSLNGIDRRLKSLATKDTRIVVDLTKAENDDNVEGHNEAVKTPARKASKSGERQATRPVPRQARKKASTDAPTQRDDSTRPHATRPTPRQVGKKASTSAIAQRVLEFDPVSLLPGPSASTQQVMEYSPEALHSGPSASPAALDGGPSALRMGPADRQLPSFASLFPTQVQPPPPPGQSYEAHSHTGFHNP